MRLFIAMMINPRPIETEEEYEPAQKEIEQLFGIEPGTPEGERLETLISLVEAYEDLHYPFPPEEF